MKYCRECGKEINENAVVCVHCGCAIENKNNINERSKAVAFLLRFFLGGLGGHKFYVNNSSMGIVYALCNTIGWFLFCIPPFVIAILNIIDIVNIIKGELDGVKLI